MLGHDPDIVSDGRYVKRRAAALRHNRDGDPTAEAGFELDVQHGARQIIERINAYFGYAAVAELRIVQAPVGVKGELTRLAPRPAAPPLTYEVAHIADPGLRDALARLGAEVKAGR